MAASQTKKPATTKKKSKVTTIDSIYQKYMKSVVRALGSTEFYEFFIDAISKAQNEFQFSNRRMEKYVDLKWVDAIEEALTGMQKIISNPRNIIREDELIVNVAHAKKAGSDVVRHLAQHGQLVEDFNEDTGNVRPGRLMQKFREDTTELYENRVAFTTIEYAYNFVKVRHEALFQAMGEEYGAKLKVSSNMESATELLEADMYLHIRKKDSAMEVDEKNQDVFARIDRMNRLLASFMSSEYCQRLAKLPRVKGNLVKTNVLKKNPEYKKIAKLYDFLRSYTDVGYVIKITEQNPQIDEVMEQNIYHNIMFQYIILKGYLEDEGDRELPKPMKQRKRQLKPKVIREIIEELTEDYDLPDVEIRKVLIEELTKEQLMQEEAAERLRLVEEAEERKRQEEEAARLAAEEEEKKRLAEEEAEAERLRLEEEEAERKRKVEEMERALEDRRRATIFQKELEYFADKLFERQAEREELRRSAEEQMEQLDYIDAVKLLEEAEERKRQEAEIKLRKKQEAEERKRLAEEAKLAEERRLAEAEAERIRVQLEIEQAAQDSEAVKLYVEEVRYFQAMLFARRQQRVEQKEEERMLRERVVAERENRVTAREEAAMKPQKRRFRFR